MARKILGIFDKRPLIWFHYVLLVILLYTSWWIGDALFNELFLKFYIMAPWLFVWLAVGDQLIHSVMGVD